MITRKKNQIILFWAIISLMSASLLTFSSSSASFAWLIGASDAGTVARFDIDIIVPEELGYASAENPYQYVFGLNDETMLLAFTVVNNSEVVVVCEPEMSNGVKYSVWVGEIACKSFLVDIGESVDFQVVVTPNGLNGNAIDTTLILDVQQAGGE